MTMVKEHAGDNIIKTVVHVSREYGELAGAGGIKDVTEGLCRASAARGIATHVFLPFYRTVKGKIETSIMSSFGVAMDYVGQTRTEHVTSYRAELAPNLTLHLIDAPCYQYLLENKSIERHGIYTYTADEARLLGRPDLQGQGYFDFFSMNVLLVKSTLHVLGAMNIRPDIIHCHDGHAALLPVLAQASDENFSPYLRYAPSLITIHNAGKGYHQEIDDLDFAAAVCGLPNEVVSSCLLGRSFDPLWAGGLFASAINTVSENYARELQDTGQDWRTGWLGHKLAAYGVPLRGVTNGVDPKSQIPADWRGLDRKEGFKRQLLNRLAESLPGGISAAGKIQYRENVPLFTFVGRLDRQKGFDILADAVEGILAEENDIQLLGLGDGAPDLVAQFDALALRFQGRVRLLKGYSPELAKDIYGAGDFFLIPSRFEPCGLTDFFAQLVGNVPIVHSVGGLVKTVDGRFGLSYLGGAPELHAALKRALELYREPGRAGLRKIQKDAIANIMANFTWDKVLDKKYLPLYRRIVERSSPASPYL